MLQPRTIYSDTNKIAHDAYKICETLGRAFKVYKNDSSKYILRCRDCGAASCFSIRATASIIDGVGAWKITTSHLTFMCSNLGKRNKQYSIKQLMGWGVGGEERGVGGGRGQTQRKDKAIDHKTRQDQTRPNKT